MGVWYTTREAVRRSLESSDSVEYRYRVDAAIESASRGMEDLINRKLYPQRVDYRWDYPDQASLGTPPWRQWVGGGNQLISVASLSIAGTAVPAQAIILEPNRYGPPYDRIEFDQTYGYVLSPGSTWQQSVRMTGWVGHTDEQQVIGTLSGSISDTVGTLQVAAGGWVETGHLLSVDDERMIVTDTAWVSTGQTLSGGLTASAGDRSIPVADGAAWRGGETLIIDAERMLVIDIVGNSLIVKRAVDGSVLAAHSIGATIYAPRLATVTRAAVGTSAAAHSSGATVTRWVPPGQAEELCIAEAMNTLLQQAGGYTRTIGSGDSARPATGEGLADLRTRFVRSFARQARSLAV